MKLFLKDRPVGSKDREVLRKDLEMLQALVGKWQEDDYERVVSGLSEEEACWTLDYIHRFNQLIMESDNPNISSGGLLRLY